jgi:hypothetical protein
MRIWSTLALMALAAHPLVGRAQSVHGAVVDNADTPLPGVVVLLLDSNGKEVGRVLSSARGEYRLVVPRAGQYRVRTLRIGFRQSLTEPITLGASDDIARRLVLDGIAFSLDTVRAIGRNPCRVVTSDSSSVIASVWNDVRGALIATQLTVNTRTMIATTLTYDRTTDERSGRIGMQTVDVVSAFSRQPWLSAAPDALSTNGYVYTTPDDIRVYNAPGLDALLSDDFVEDHCLRLAPDSDDTRLGIRFQPTPGRDKVTDIRGTLWLDRATNELRELEYHYVNVSRDEERTAGGTIGFSRLRNGMWAISDWNIRMPMIVLVPVYDGALKIVAREARIDSIRVTGGQLIAAVLSSSRGRDTIWTRPALVLRGMITDSLTHDPIARAVVALGGTGQVDTTDASGQFSFPRVLQGRYVVETRTPSLDSVNTVDQRSVLFADTSTSISIPVPNASMITSSVCGPRPLDSGRGILFGSVGVSRDTTRRSGTRVWATWSAEAAKAPNDSANGARTHTLETRTDARGDFRMCGIPVDVAFTLRASDDSAEAAPVRVRIPDDGRFAHVDIVLDQSLSIAGVFAGTVVTESPAMPLPGVEIVLPDLGLTTRSDSAGAFRIAGVVPGNRKVVARRVGYGVMESEIEFTAGVTTDRRIVLARVTLLDSLLTTADRDNDPLLRAFDERRRMGLGQFVTREEIARRETALLSSFLQQRPGLNLLSTTGNDFVEGKRPMPSSCGRVPGPPPRSVDPDGSMAKCLRREGVYYVPEKADQEQGTPVACYARVYLDNQLMNPGTPSPPFNLRQVQPTQVEAMEFYAGSTQVPVEFLARNSSCGVLVIHTRRYRPAGSGSRDPSR